MNTNNFAMTLIKNLNDKLHMWEYKPKCLFYSFYGVHNIISYKVIINLAHGPNKRFKNLTIKSEISITNT